MLAKITSSAVLGIDAFPVEVEVDLTHGLPGFATVGLPDLAVREAKDRVKAALKNTGFRFPPKRITVNLAPADIKKEGSGFDLPMALGLLVAEGILKQSQVDGYTVAGELSLDGRVRPVRGMLSMAVGARSDGCRGLILSHENAAEAAVVDAVPVYGVKTIPQVVAFLQGRQDIPPTRLDLKKVFALASTYSEDFAEVKGQDHAKRAIEVAAAGGHNLIMVGPPGSGKTMLARRLATVLPEMTLEEAIETTKIHSVAGALPAGKSLVATRPFRSPHHTISDAGLIGGGQVPRPGEVSMAHHGVLFLDELPEFKRNALEVLRQPLEDRRVTIARAITSITYPAHFMLVAAMNPCPCGYYTDPQHACLCTPLQIRRYRTRISGPLVDRIDLHVEVPAVAVQELSQPGDGEPSEAIRQRVNAARQVQRGRFQQDGLFCNAQMKSRHLKKYCSLDDSGKALLEQAMERLGLSARAYTRILKVTRTIADLEASETIQPHHLSEAIQYRTLDRKMTG